ncbi:hypothetical protein AGDE_01624 [Angomonas deanei]|uniref:Uncharacterized protein n=1 Tax=Angomonas deanei TaxID=59799 RepID=A0A7G2C4P6_9TRYP|nr:hypothetical protein AGDE_01624 [Angomonas deanei]CAD2214589.1 hypothetical protein, conserved [Angomonas deanei]|eukprot:EPY42299.1 hypothetical protein AGDE_01624 [Angomonas deanei]
MTSHGKPVVVALDDYTPEQHLVAGISEYNKLEGANQSQVQAMYNTLTSPFKITQKPCEAMAEEVVQCYQREIKGENNHNNNNENVYRCYALVNNYKSCVEEKLKEHAGWSSTFAEKNLSGMKETTEI